MLHWLQQLHPVERVSLAALSVVVLGIFVWAAVTLLTAAPRDQAIGC